MVVWNVYNSRSGIRFSLMMNKSYIFKRPHQNSQCPILSGPFCVLKIPVSGWKILTHESKKAKTVERIEFKDSVASYENRYENIIRNRLIIYTVDMSPKFRKIVCI